MRGWKTNIQASKEWLWERYSLALRVWRGGEIHIAHKAGIAVEEFDARRRAFLKYALFGGAVFLAGRYLNPLVNALRGDTVLSEKTFENFKITETGRKLFVTDDEGDEILSIDKESF